MPILAPEFCNIKSEVALISKSLPTMLNCATEPPVLFNCNIVWVPVPPESVRCITVVVVEALLSTSNMASGLVSPMPTLPSITTSCLVVPPPTTDLKCVVKADVPEPGTPLGT